MERLQAESDKRRVSLTEVIQQGLETDLFLTNEERNGGKILVEKEDHRLVQIFRT